MKKRYRVAAVLLSLVLLLTAGCSDSGEPSQTAEASIPTEAAPAASAETEIALTGEASLLSLRQAMAETPELFAVAYFGCADGIDADGSVDPIALIREKAPGLCADLPFLPEIPANKIIGTGRDLFCIVPMDEAATVAVSKGAWDESSGQYLYENSLYFEESGEPILLLCNSEGFEPDTQLYISSPSGEVIWYPQTDDNRCAMALKNDNWENLFLDFSPYRELLTAKYQSMKGQWILPTADMLFGTTWVWEGYSDAGLETSYQVSFHPDTLSVQWNDGIDAQDHLYPDAPWDLRCDGETAILSIDFREFAGALRYHLLYHEDLGQLYVAMDTLQEEMPIGWEPLYRFLSRPSVPEPVEMLGQWALAWTEVEGDRTEPDPEAELVEIFLNDANGFRITLTDEITPDRSFQNKELAVYEGTLYSGCGNDLWMAYIGYMGKTDAIYSLTLLPDDTLLMEIYWEIDGGVPMTAHKGYRRMQ